MVTVVQIFCSPPLCACSASGTKCESRRSFHLIVHFPFSTLIPQNSTRTRFFIGQLFVMSNLKPWEDDAAAQDAQGESLNRRPLHSRYPAMNSDPPHSAVDLRNSFDTSSFEGDQTNADQNPVPVTLGGFLALTAVVSKRCRTFPWPNCPYLSRPAL